METDEYQDIDITIGQQIKFIDDNSNHQWGQVLRVDTEMDMVQVVYGCIIQQLSWVHANDITSV